MRNRRTILATVLPVILVFSAGIANAQDDKEKFKARYESNSVNKEFDPHDFTGIWEMTRLDHSLGAPVPALTPAGVAAMAGRVVDKPGVIGNAPWYTCNPMGFPRLLNDDEPMEFIMTKEKILQVFQWEHRIRYIWTDGRQAPSGQNLENLDAARCGHSASEWNRTGVTV